MARWLGLWLACAAAAAAAADPPLDPWSDPQWRLPLAGLTATQVRSVRWREALYAPGAESASSSRESRLEFAADGRLQVFDTEHGHPDGTDERHRWHYRWHASGALERIGEDGSAPLLQRQFDAQRRIEVQLERRGEAVHRTAFRYDAAGRERERVTDQGKGTARTRERRSYHPNGVLKSIDTDAAGGPVRTIVFDPLGRPVKITSRDAQALRVTQIRYPSPLSAVYDDSAALMSARGSRKYRREVSFSVRQADELRRAGEPEQPLSRREVRDGTVFETLTDFDAGGRPLHRRQLVDAQVRCITDWQYHASGLLLSARSRDGSAHCGDSPDVDAEIEVDEHGNWVRQVVYVSHADGRRTRAAERTREIDYR
ncbi:MAG: hypothetical protein LKCHEGNO_01919 [Burkholderiaceae bacterium]|nr:hypothetical protein [Burkholderiaceae bacterium]